MALNKMEPQIVDYYLQPQNKEEALKEENANLKKEKENLHNKVKWVEKRLAKSEAENKKLNTIFQAKCATKDYKLTNGIVIQATQSEIDIVKLREERFWEADSFMNLKDKFDEIMYDDKDNCPYEFDDNITPVQNKWKGWDYRVNDVFKLKEENEKLKKENEELKKYERMVMEAMEAEKAEEASCDDEDDNPTPRCDYCNRTYDEVMAQDDHPDAWNGETGCCFRCVERWDWMLLQLYGQ